MQNDALVAQMEGMSHEEQQQFLAQQVNERVSLAFDHPSPPPFSLYCTPTSACCLAELCSPCAPLKTLPSLHANLYITSLEASKLTTACPNMQPPGMCLFKPSKCGMTCILQCRVCASAAIAYDIGCMARVQLGCLEPAACWYAAESASH